ncbi:MAG: GDP-mannose 4,6-dehydratase [Methanomicrobiales archaeon HGW-Methanomicrobiales-4]|nr:MAG: GDP-mannose 4,6-dehydratase [Methanomicrobiales archaeon HGW-Methanomicrobiales-4]
MKYIVTGGAGFIGSHLSEALVAGGHELIIIDDLSSGRMENLSEIINHPDVTFHQESILNRPALHTLFEGADGVFHQAALVSVPKSIDDPAASHAITLTGTLNMLLVASDVGVKKVVSASSAAVYGNLLSLRKREDMPVDPLSPYGVEKHASREYFRIFSSLYGLSTVCLRYFNVYGPRRDPHSDYSAAVPKFIQRISSGKPSLIYGDGEQTRDFVYVKDVVQANIRAMPLGSASGVYNIANGVGIRVNDLAVTVLRVMGSEMRPVYADARSGEVKHSVADVSRARGEFGFEPGYTLEKGLGEMKNAQ